MIPLTILTAPLGQRNILQQQYRNFSLRVINRPIIESGHAAVTTSLLRGLKIIRADFLFNPNYFESTEVCIVLSNIKALRQAIDLKKQGRIKTLLAGPNLVVRSNEFNVLLGDPAIDWCIVPSAWVQQAYIEDAPSLEGRILVWAAGVNTDFWLPGNHSRSNYLIYKKSKNKIFLDLTTYLTKNGLPYKIIEYGKYGRRDYLKMLQRATKMIFLSDSESQGIALTEAWSCNVPTFVWQPDKVTINDKVYSEFSSAPYLSDSTGGFWENFNDLTPFLNIDLGHEPRKWVIKNQSDEACAASLMTHIRSAQG